MRSLNTDKLLYGEVLIDRHVWIDAVTRGLDKRGEESKIKSIEHRHKVIAQVTNWRFILTVTGSEISEHITYFSFSWADIHKISSSVGWIHIFLKDKSAISISQDNADIQSIKLWAIGEALKCEDNLWKNSLSINFHCETRVPPEGKWSAILSSYGIKMKYGENPMRINSNSDLTIEIVKKAFTRKNFANTNDNDSQRINDSKQGSGKDPCSKPNHTKAKKEEPNFDKNNKNEADGERVQNIDVNSNNGANNYDDNMANQFNKNHAKRRHSPSQQKVLNEINALIGLEEVKERITDIVNLAAINEERRRQGLNTPIMSLHMVFTGNPGTGKTTIARMLGNIFKALGLLAKGHFVEIDRAGLVGGYLGQTAIKTTAVLESALGGVLFIDEAYTLSPGQNGDLFGQEAIDTILAFMENNRDNIVIIAAGYTDQMSDFINTNLGLKSRFSTFINFDDYSPEEMKKIFLSMAYADNYVVNSICDAELDDIFSSVSTRSGKGFGNGREVRNIYEKTLLKQGGRLMSLEALDRNRLIEILPCDLPSQKIHKPAETSINKQAERTKLDINQLVGIAAVKKEIKKIIDMARMSKIRSEAGLPLMSPSLHMVFTGSPGTGKTTVARCLSQELHELGILTRDQIVEVSRSDLVAGYLGQTAIKTTKVLESALGGILFVDEAYTLNQQYVGGSDSFGLEAIDTILKYMEDNKDSLMVIVAGYQHEMSRFLESNPGLSSRFNRYIHFEDYSDNELFEVFRSMADANKYVIHKDAFVAIETVISTLRQQEYSKFSNARSIRNLFEKIIENQATRLVKTNQPSRDEIQLIISDDLCDL